MAVPEGHGSGRRPGLVLRGSPEHVCHQNPELRRPVRAVPRAPAVGDPRAAAAARRARHDLTRGGMPNRKAFPFDEISVGIRGGGI